MKKGMCLVLLAAAMALPAAGVGRAGDWIPLEEYGTVDLLGGDTTQGAPEENQAENTAETPGEGDKSPQSEKRPAQTTQQRPESARGTLSGGTAFIL